MVKLRDAGYCNLKCLLIYLVIYGHLMEPMIWHFSSAMVQYRWIYQVHMPLFSFLSGLFLDSAESCRRQALRCLPLYFFCQSMVLICTNWKTGDTPYWHLWYLLSCAFWSALAWLWFRAGCHFGAAILLLSLAASFLGGFVREIGRAWSLSRSLVFFPYFWSGVLCPRDLPFHQHRGLGLAALLLGSGLVFSLRIHPYVLYQASGYNTTGGLWDRLLCYLIGALLGIGLLCLVPQRRCFLTQLGADTMPAYLLHPLIALPLQELALPLWGMALAAAVFLAILHLILRWSGSLYGIIPKERRNSHGQLPGHLRILRPKCLSVPPDAHR